jgi:hypothetical protein
MRILPTLRTCVLISLLLPLVPGCGGTPSQTDTVLRYTVSDANGVRAGLNRASVLKTLGMTEEQIQQWARDPAAAEEKRAVGYELITKPAGLGTYAVTNETGSVTSRDADSAAEALRMPDEERRKWVEDESGVSQGRSATFFKEGHNEAIWRDGSGKLRYTIVNLRGTRTSSDQASVLKTLGMNDEQLMALAEDEKAADEARAVSIIGAGHVVRISRGVWVEPPGRTGYQGMSQPPRRSSGMNAFYSRCGRCGPA